MNISDFRNPPKKYRGVPFWSWNNDLEDEELIRQIDEMEEKGRGGYFMHARVGLVTPYLSYSKRIYGWCDENNLKYTGHYMAEDTLTSQIMWVAAAMPHYEFMHYPGMDHLGRNINNLTTAKQVSSVAHQLGKKRVLSEMYGCSGQAFSFEGRKWIGDWHLINGINIVNQHLSLYTMRGERKRDYPPNIFWQQPWWKHNRPVADYFARLCYALTQGRRFLKILVIHPIESAWTLYRPGDTKDSDALHAKFAKLSEDLLAMNWDFDYGDESIMSRHAGVDDGKLRVGEMDYDVVIVPPAITLRSSTVELLERFISGGGKVIAIEHLPEMIDGVKDARVQGVLRRGIVIEDRKTALREALDKALSKDVEVRSAEGEDIGPVWHHRRRAGDLEIYFFSNTSQDEECDAEVSLDVTGKVEKWDPLTGDKVEIPSQQSGGRTKLKLHFERTGSYLITVDRSGSPSKEIKVDEFKPIREIPLGGTWKIQRCDPNALTLDYCRYKSEGGEWGERIPVWKALGSAKAEGGRFSLLYSFDFGVVPEGEIFFVLETPERYEILVNGRPVDRRDWGFWVDTSFGKIDITRMVKAGENTVKLSGEMSQGTEVESCYLVGDFGVEEVGDGKFRIVSEAQGGRAEGFGQERLSLLRGLHPAFSEGPAEQSGGETS